MESIINKYHTILEPLQNNDIEKINDIHDHKLYTITTEIAKKYCNQNVLVSLSGGVDSMVLVELLYKNPNINIYCCHVNYNNRIESTDEMEFLREYCKHKNIVFEYIEFDFTRVDTKRDIYEKETRKLRYDYYCKLIEKYNCNCVMLAHHKDDIVENIYNNVMRGCRDPNDLVVLCEFNKILDVNVCRPLLSVYKDCIYDFARTYKIPYFLDTTPDWSCRGKMRRKIFPDCEECYGSQYKENLIQLGEECHSMGNIIQKHIIDNIFENNVKIEGVNFEINITDVLCERIILKIVLKKILHRLGVNMIKMKSISQLSNIMQTKRCQKITLLKNYNTMVTENSIIFTKL